uniref:VP2 n=1 Tax=Fomede virus TaxID=2547356 RepID=A0A482AC26_9REOV|nr:VP2 [Fomede virus]
MAEPTAAADQRRRNPEPTAAPYLKGEEVKDDNGPLLSVFALQEIINKVREAQTRLAASVAETPAASPQVESILRGISDLDTIKGYTVQNTVPISYIHEAVQSDEKFFRIDKHMMELSSVAADVDCDDPQGLITAIVRRIHYYRDKGSFLLWDTPTHFIEGREVVDHSALGLDVESLLRAVHPRDRHRVQRELDMYHVLNAEVRGVLVDTYTAALPQTVYEVHRQLTEHVLEGQRGVFHESMRWLQAYGEFKDLEFSEELLTDIYCTDTIYCMSYHLPVDPTVIWEVPRSGIANLLMNAALGIPTGRYINPSPKIASVTVTSRVTTTSAFSQMQSIVPTEAQMNDVRKIYLALMFPNQIVIDVRAEPGNTVDQVVHAVAGVVGKLMFSFGPHIFNITARTARLLDRACAMYIKMTADDRRTIRHGRTGDPLDFQIIQGQRQVDCNQLANDPRTGAGYNAWRVDDLGDRECPYPHLRRYIKYLGYTPEDIIDERFTGQDHRFPLMELLGNILTVAGHTNERNYLEGMLQHHVVRFAHISQICNRDLSSAFSAPDDRFAQLGEQIGNGWIVGDGPLVLDVSYHAIWFAYKMRFLPISRPDMQLTQPLIESIYGSQISIAKYQAQRIDEFVRENPESFPGIRPMDVWRCVVSEMPTAIRQVLELVGQHAFVNGRDIGQWRYAPAMQESLPLLCERAAWNSFYGPEAVMFTREVYLHREIIPEFTLEDVERFRRNAEFYTNLHQNTPPADERVYLNRSSMLQRAGEGRLNIAMRRYLDDDLYIQVGNILRPLCFQVCKTLPPLNVREALPYNYTRIKNDGPTARVNVSLSKSVQGFLMLYTADEQAFPDEMTTLVPAVCLTYIKTPDLPFQRVTVDDALSIVMRDVMAIRGKIRIHDLTAALKAGSKFASPQMD